MSQIHSFIIDFTYLANKQPDKLAVLDGEGRKLNYRELANYVENAQAFLSKLGMKSGDTLVTLLPNAIETLIIFLACLRGGYIYAPLPCTSTLTEVSQWKELTKSHICLTADPVTNSVQDQLINMDWKVLVISIGGDFDWLGSDTITSNSGGRLLIASSGSTGDPKAIVLDADRLWSAGRAFLEHHKIKLNEIRFWNYLPMSYLGGLFNLGLIPLAAGGSIFIDEPFSGKTFLTFWSTVERFKINSLWLVPSILRGLLTLADRVGQVIHSNTVQRCYLGTAPISLIEKQRFSKVFGIELLENYGLSETTFISSEKISSLVSRSEGSVGSIMPNINIKLSEVYSEGVALNEILVRTPFMMLGYLNKKGHLELPFDENGFMRTGDYGQIKENQLLITGRCRDIIKKGGILISLREIEIFAEGIDGILEAAAARLDHPFYGESYELYIRLKQLIKDEKIFLDHFSTQFHKLIARHKWPERIITCDDFPRTDSGKIQKHLLSNIKV